MDQGETFKAVGQALSYWEYFEGYLGMLYAFFVGAEKHTSPAMRAYGAVTGFTTRLDMIKEAASAHFFSMKTEVPRPLSDLLNDAKNFSPRRNEIAHGIVQPYYSGGLAHSGYALGPSRYATRKLKLRYLEHIQQDGVSAEYAYTSTEIVMFGSHFKSLADNTMSIWMEISKIRPSRATR